MNVIYKIVKDTFGSHGCDCLRYFLLGCDTMQFCRQVQQNIQLKLLLSTSA